MQKEIIDYIRKFQLTQFIDLDKYNLEIDKKLNDFIDLLLQNMEFLPLFYKNRKKFNKIIIPKETEINLAHFSQKVFPLIKNSKCVGEFYFLLNNQMEAYYENFKVVRKYIQFLNLLVNRGFLNQINEYFCFCNECNKYYITNEMILKCVCGEQNLIFKFSFILDIIKKSMQSGHLLEHITLNYLKSKGKLLVGTNYNGNEIFTSLQYSGVGSGKKENAEFDLIVLEKNTVVFFECKFNKTAYREIKDFLVSSENFMNLILQKFEFLQIKRIIVAYDASKLEIPNDARDVVVLDLKNNHFSFSF